ncbi:MAG: hypothetical protein FJ297_11655 [Planctomycetes bacterium]|nr:hypothetical protein [Planctomycetota bacterium]
MARKTVNRRELREQAEAAEALESKSPAKAEKTAKAAVEKKPAPKRKSRAKEPVDKRFKLYWGVFNQSLKRVALFEFNQQKQAQEKAEALTASGKSPHFVKKEKIEITD